MLWFATFIGLMRRLVPETKTTVPTYEPYTAKLLNRDIEEQLRSVARWW